MIRTIDWLTRKGLGLLTLLLVVLVSVSALFVGQKFSHMISSPAPLAQAHQVWGELEEFFSYSPYASWFLDDLENGQKRSMPMKDKVPLIGMEWRESGWIIRDIYPLTEEDALIWQLTEKGSHARFVKVTLVPKPSRDEKVTMEYLLGAPEMTRFISISSGRRPASERKTKELPTSYPAGSSPIFQKINL